MDVAALVTWVLTAGGGFVLLGTWLAKGGLDQARRNESKFPPGVVFGHFLLAATGLVVWIAFLASDESSGTAWAAFGILLVVALLGFTLFGRWISGRRSQPHAAEQRLPTPVVYLHGLLGATTLVLVLLTAADAAN